MSLERAGYSVSTVKNGVAALEEVRRVLPDVLISDIEMPRMDGKELLSKITSEFPDRDFPIFIMTSRTNLEYRTWLEQFSNVHFLEKPVSTRRLIAVLEEYKEAAETP